MRWVSFWVGVLVLGCGGAGSGPVTTVVAAPVQETPPASEAVVRWELLPGVAPADHYQAVHAFDATHAVAVGWGMAHLEGTRWRMVRIHEEPNHTFTAVWGRAPDDVFASRRSSLWHFDGARWTRVELPTQSERPGLGVMCGTDDGQLFVGGGARELFHHDGRRWRRIELPDVYGDLWDIACRAADDVWLVGRSGKALHYDGEQVHHLPVDGIDQVLSGVVQVEGGVVVYGHHGIYRRAAGPPSEGGWQHVLDTERETVGHLSFAHGLAIALAHRQAYTSRDLVRWEPHEAGFNRVVVLGPNEALAGAFNFGGVSRWDGTTWTSELRMGHWQDVAHAGPATFFAGHHGVAWHDGERWSSPAPTRDPTEPENPMERGTRTWVSDDGHFFHADRVGIRVVRPDGSGAALADVRAFAVHGRASDDVYFGADEVTYHWNGEAFTTIEGGSSAFIEHEGALLGLAMDGHLRRLENGAAVRAAPGPMPAGDPHLLVLDGEVAAFDGELWRAGVEDPVEGSELPEEIRSAWGSDWDDVYAVVAPERERPPERMCDDCEPPEEDADERQFLGSLWHYDGNGWSRVSALDGVDPHAVVGLSRTEVWVSLSDGDVMGFDGSEWARVRGYGGGLLHDLWVHEGVVYGAGGRTAVRRVVAGVERRGPASTR